MAEPETQPLKASDVRPIIFETELDGKPTAITGEQNKMLVGQNILDTSQPPIGDNLGESFLINPNDLRQ